MAVLNGRGAEALPVSALLVRKIASDHAHFEGGLSYGRDRKKQNHNYGAVNHRYKSVMRSVVGPAECPFISFV